jgi:Glutathionylspermidine synthase preATP-grasp
MGYLVGSAVTRAVIDLPPCNPGDWKCPGPLPPDDFARLRRRLVLECCKWDPQVADTETVARFPLVVPGHVLGSLGRLAESLDREGEAAARELGQRPDLVRRLGLPRRLARVLTDSSRPWTPAAARVVRFDFHPTTEGWRISEANSDVPGGYSEATHLPAMMEDHFPGTRRWGDPQTAVAQTITDGTGGPGRAALLAAPGYMEDLQVIAGLGSALRRLGWQTCVGRPGQVTWTDGQAGFATRRGTLAVDALVRFFQGEWLPRLSRGPGWESFLRGARTSVCNPGLGLFTESKRFPVIWDRLKAPVPTWRALLPETRDPGTAIWRQSEWLLKGAYGNNGDEVVGRALTARRLWRNASWSARLWPSAWAAQRRFVPLPVETPAGPMYPCLGIYTVNGRCAGVYGRLSPGPLIDFAAVDVAVLARGESGTKDHP